MMKLVSNNITPNNNLVIIKNILFMKSVKMELSRPAIRYVILYVHEIKRKCYYNRLIFSLKM